MKKLLLTTIFFTLFNLLYGQTSSQLLTIQANPPQQVDNPTILGVRLEGSAWRIYAFNKWKIIDTTDKIATKTGLSLKVNNSRTITINGTSYDLSSNRSWNVGDVITSGSYVNPNWISSLSYSKITDAPMIPNNNNQLTNGAGYISTETDPIWNSEKSSYRTKSQNDVLYYPLSGNPSSFLTSFTELDPTVPSYAKSLSTFSVIKSSTDVLYKGIDYSPSSLEISTALGYTPYSSSNPSGYITQSGARGAISLSTSGSGAATYNSSTGVLNVPTPSIVSYTSGMGISLASNVITNTAPDQTVTLTGGNRINITGSYPNFTISYVEPSINQVSRAVNTNFTIGTRQATVMYSIPVTATNPLLAGTSVGSAFLEYSVNSGTTWTTALSTSASSQVGLAVAIALTTGGSNMLTGVVPANALVRIRSTISGTATVGTATGQEVF